MLVEDRARLHALQDRAREFREFAGHLPRSERALLDALFLEGHTLTTLSRLLGLWPSTLHRRLERVVTRISSPKFAYFVQKLPALRPTRQRVARACILHGLSLRAAAAELRMPMHVLRAHALALHAMFEAV